MTGSAPGRSRSSSSVDSRRDSVLLLLCSDVEYALLLSFSRAGSVRGSIPSTCLEPFASLSDVEVTAVGNDTDGGEDSMEIIGGSSSVGLSPPDAPPAPRLRP